MQLVDPLSKAHFVISPLAKLPWIARPLSRLAVGRARSAARRQNWPTSSLEYTNALRLDPKNAMVWVQLGHCLGNQGAPDAAQIAYLNATYAKPRLAIGHKQIGLVRFQTALHDESIQSLATALFLDATDGELRRLLIAEIGEVAIERQMAIAALMLSDGYRSAHYIGVRSTLLRAKARAAARQRRWAEAESLYRRLIGLRPGDAQLLIQLGNSLTEQKRHLEAEQAYRQASVADPLVADAWLHLGYSLAAQEQPLLAREAFAVVDRIAPARRTAHPIMDTLIEVSAPEPELHASRRLECPVGLGAREKAIWRRLATQIESGN